MYPYDHDYLQAVGILFIVTTALSVGWALFRTVI
jgi:hypothetical protein